ncbi:toprim domain-containing protein [Candidatus Woesearchaeota archaeon]|nr:toprim domain-containing protein [Candidatus Woesearchaeota archaeon]
MDILEKEILDKWIIDVNETQTPLIVEGKKDVAALRNIGIRNRIFSLNKPLYSFVEQIVESTDSIIILTDLDREGKELYHKLKTGLERFGVKVDRRFRERLQKNTKISHIEGIDTYYQNL